MFRWLKNRKEKKEKGRQDNEKKILNSLKSNETSGSSADYNFNEERYPENKLHDTYESSVFYKDDSTFNNKKPRDYDDIDDIPVFPEQIPRNACSNFRFGTAQDIDKNPQQLPDRIFPDTTRSLSGSALREFSDDERFRQRIYSLSSFHGSEKNFSNNSDPEAVTLYNEPWDCQSNLTVQYHADKIHLRLYKRVENTIATKDEELYSRWSLNSLEDQINFKTEGVNTEFEFDVVSQTGSNYSVPTEETNYIPNVGGLKSSVQSFNLEADETTNSDASRGFSDGHSELNDEHKLLLSKPLGNSENTISSASSLRFNTLPRSRCSKMYEDSEIYLIPKRRCSFKENKTEFISQTGSDYSVFTEETRDATNIFISLQSLNFDADKASDSDASSGFYDGPSDIDEEHIIKMLKSFGNQDNTISSVILLRFNTYPRSRCSKIYEDSELYLIPKGRCNEANAGIHDLPV